MSLKLYLSWLLALFPDLDLFVAQIASLVVLILPPEECKFVLSCCFVIFFSLCFRIFSAAALVAVVLLLLSFDAGFRSGSVLHSLGHL